jgi:thiosulfate dehydrogenase (quinone) large subunit
MEKSSFTQTQATSLILLRLFIGWHFLYEGVLKLYNPSWTAKGYLLSAEFLRPVFALMADDSVIQIVNTLNIAGLLVIGISLVLGVKTNWGCIAGMILLAFYYLAHPPFSSVTSGPAEGSYWIVNKNLIELAALFVLYLFPTAGTFGLERLLHGKNYQESVQPKEA